MTDPLLSSLSHFSIIFWTDLGSTNILLKGNRCLFLISSHGEITEQSKPAKLLCGFHVILCAKLVGYYPHIEMMLNYTE